MRNKQSGFILAATFYWVAAFTVGFMATAVATHESVSQEVSQKVDK